VHAVVGGEDGHRGRGGRWRGADAGQAGEPDAHVLERAERPARLGEPVLTVARLGESPLVGRVDRDEGLVEQPRHGQLSTIGGTTPL
jgi:hypothetical protein